MQENINETMVSSRTYELASIFVNTISEEAALEKFDAVKQLIASEGASFISEEAPYLRGLAYEMIRVIKNANTRFNSGYFSWVKFDLEPAKLINIKKKLDLDEEIIRFMIVKADKDSNIITRREEDKMTPIEVADPSQIDTTVSDLEEVIAPLEVVEEVVAEKAI